MTEPTTKYIISCYRAEIQERVCTKETAHFVWLESMDHRGRVSVSQQRKDGNVFDSWAEAHAELVRRAENNLSAARRQLEKAQRFVDDVCGMKEPTL